MSKYQKALDGIIECYEELESMVGNDPNKVKEFNNIKVLQEAVDKANKYDEKETPKKPPLTWECAKPKTRCKCTAGVEKYHSYCWNCGQKLDWSDVDE